MEQQFASNATSGDMTTSNDANKGQFLTNLPFLKSLGSQRKTQSPGQIPKKRGPKPDTKPALTRRQELNRQAQRTHRERKEQYVRALENEVSRLREAYSELTRTSHTTNEQLKQALQAVMEENKILQNLLSSHGIAFKHEIPAVRTMLSAPATGDAAAPFSELGVYGGSGTASDGGNTHRGPGTVTPHETQNYAQGSVYEDGATQRAMEEASTSPSMCAPSMTADTSAGPSPGQVTSEQTTKSNPADEQSSRTHGSVGTNLAAQPSTFATSVTGPDTSLASADPSLLLTPDAGTASTRILPPLAEDASTMSYHTTSPLPPLLPPHHFTSFNSGASSAMNTIAWTGHDSHWNLIENEEAIGAIPGVFEKDPQLEMDFILSLESPCRNHMEFLNRRALNDPEQELYCGHALMATCPPPSQVISTPPGQLYPVETYNLPQASLSKLLNLSRQLVTEGQITPIMAVQNIKCHALYNDLTIQDIRQMINELSSKIRCYGFGAVMEDFEFMDSLTAILKSKTSCADSIGMAVRAADRYKQMFGQKLAGVNTHKNLDGRYIGGGGVAGPGMPQVDEFLFV